MATRITPQDQRQDGGLKQKNLQGDNNINRKNRPALGDIGNLVKAPAVHGKDKPVTTKINRPITRSFGAQLLANAQQAADKNKKQGEKVADLGIVPRKGGAAVVSKPAVVGQKKLLQPCNKVPVKVAAGPSENGRALKGGGPLSENGRVIVIKEDASKKKGPSFTSVLAARSKEACAVPKKALKEPIVDIDEGDINNELAVVEYIEDINQFYKLSEDESRLQDYMSKQPDINERMRSILVDWLIEVHYKFQLRQETLYLTINIVDRFLSVKPVPRKELQLVGMSSLLIASKYEEIWPTEVNDLVCISDKAYTNTQVLAMEKAILGKLAWELTVSTPYMFLPRYIKASSVTSDVEVEKMVYFYAELGLMNYSTMVSFRPSILAASSVYAARCTLNKTASWTETLKHYTGYSESQLKECAKVLVKLHSLAPENKLKAVYKKYSKSDFESVALKSPAKILLA